MKGDKANFNVSQRALVSRKNPLMCIPAHKGEGQMMAVHLVLVWSEAVSILRKLPLKFDWKCRLTLEFMKRK